MEVTAGLPSSQKDLHLHLPCQCHSVTARAATPLHTAGEC